MPARIAYAERLRPAFEWFLSRLRGCLLRARVLKDERYEIRRAERRRRILRPRVDVRTGDRSAEQRSQSAAIFDYRIPRLLETVNIDQNVLHDRSSRSRRAPRKQGGFQERR